MKEHVYVHHVLRYLKQQLFFRWLFMNVLSINDSYMGWTYLKASAATHAAGCVYFENSSYSCQGQAHMNTCKTRLFV